MTALPDIVPTDFRIQVRSRLPWNPDETIYHHCRWLDDALEYLLARDIGLDLVARVEFQQVHNQAWTRIQDRDLQEAISRITTEVVR